MIFLNSISRNRKSVTFRSMRSPLTNTGFQYHTFYPKEAIKKDPQKISETREKITSETKLQNYIKEQQQKKLFAKITPESLRSRHKIYILAHPATQSQLRRTNKAKLIPALATNCLQTTELSKDMNEINTNEGRLLTF